MDFLAFIVYIFYLLVLSKCPMLGGFLADQLLNSQAVRIITEYGIAMAHSSVVNVDLISGSLNHLIQH